MSDEIVFPHHPTSRAGIAPWMPEEVGAPCRLVSLDHRTAMRTLDDLALDPMGKAPAVVRRGRPVTGTPAIRACLAAFPEAAPADRAQAEVAARAEASA